MFDHLGIGVSDLATARVFYAAALAPLRIEPTFGGDTVAAFGRDGRTGFLLTTRPPSAIHVAFAAESRAQVDAFHAAALAAGGKDNGGPGIRPNLHEHYYAAFVHDADGNNVEAVCHAPQ
jgi:catechol 2,3-dioxygenase-like lactoylglutathione lyase family enzyme